MAHQPAPCASSAFLLVLTPVLSTLLALPARPAPLPVRTLMHGGLERTYRIVLPPRPPADGTLPLVFVFHGGGGDGENVRRLTRFDELAIREGFAAVFPDGVNRNWNDGREAAAVEAQARGIDDSGFISALLDRLLSEFPVDPNRVYATGISNGAIFCHFLATRLSSRITAIAPVVGGIATKVAQSAKPSEAVSVFILQGTEDPLVPYDGGTVARNRGSIIGTASAARLWVRWNGCTGEPKKSALPDVAPGDDCRVLASTWTGGRGGSEVTLWTISGGGHTWPGGAQYFPRVIVGTVCRDVDATTAIWGFFKKHKRGK